MAKGKKEEQLTFLEPRVSLVVPHDQFTRSNAAALDKKAKDLFYRLSDTFGASSATLFSFTDAIVVAGKLSSGKCLSIPSGDSVLSVGVKGAGSPSQGAHNLDIEWSETPSSESVEVLFDGGYVEADISAVSDESTFEATPEGVIQSQVAAMRALGLNCGTCSLVVGAKDLSLAMLRLIVASTQHYFFNSQTLSEQNIYRSTAFANRLLPLENEVPPASVWGCPVLTDYSRGAFGTTEPLQNELLLRYTLFVVPTNAHNREALSTRMNKDDSSHVAHLISQAIEKGKLADIKKSLNIDELQTLKQAVCEGEEIPVDLFRFNDEWLLFTPCLSAPNLARKLEAIFGRTGFFRYFARNCASGAVGQIVQVPR